MKSSDFKMEEFIINLKNGIMKRIKLLLMLIFAGILSGFTQEITCDDFTSGNWPSDTVFYGIDTIGYSQNETQPIILGPSCTCAFNSWELGMYLIGPVKFEFDGNDQVAQFEIYAFLNQFDQMGFAVNGSEIKYLDDSFPMLLNGILVDLDTSLVNVNYWTYSYLTFTGFINEIDIIGFESGIVELCVENPESTLSVDPYSKQELSIFPNPAQDEVNIISDEIINSWEIYTISGLLVESRQMIMSNNSRINITKFEPGIYLMKIYDNNGSGSFVKLIIQ